VPQTQKKLYKVDSNLLTQKWWGIIIISIVHTEKFACLLHRNEAAAQTLVNKTQVMYNKHCLTLPAYTIMTEQQYVNYYSISNTHGIQRNVQSIPQMTSVEQYNIIMYNISRMYTGWSLMRKKNYKKITNDIKRVK